MPGNRTGFEALFIDIEEFEEGFYGVVQLIFITLAYGFILFKASNMISEGSELLLLFPSISGIVGSIILPILGAVPDGMIVLFSGLGEGGADALSVGVGALAGSTIMLLTVPWFLAIMAGKVDLDSKKVAIYKTKSANKSHLSNKWTNQGVTPLPIVKRTGKLIGITAIAYLIIQIPAFASKCYLVDDRDKCNQGVEKYFSLAGLIFCVLNFCYYLYRQFKENNDAIQLKQEQLMIKYIEQSFISLKGLFVGVHIPQHDSSQPLLHSSDSENHVKAIVAHIFKKFDQDNNKLISFDEFTLLFKALHEAPDEKLIKQIFIDIDIDRNGQINEDELLDFFVRYAFNEIQQTTPNVKVIENKHELVEEEEQEDEEAEMPEDLLTLSPKQQQIRLIIRSVCLMGFGTILVLIFSDPMVGCLNGIAKRINISAFYISFLLAPLASNASEIIASYKYALKKTQNTITISFSSLQGAACLNNTFCLAIFFAIIYFKNLAWEFTAEVIAILVIEVILIFFSYKQSNTVTDGIIIILLLPISVGIVVGLEALGLN